MCIESSSPEEEEEEEVGENVVDAAVLMSASRVVRVVGGSNDTRRIKLSNSGSSCKLARLALAPVRVIYRDNDGGVGATALPLPLPLALLLLLPPASRSAERKSACRICVAALLAGERPSIGNRANGTVTGGDILPAGIVESSS